MPERVEDEVEEQNGNRPFWSGTITFGLVSVPVELLPANRPRRASLRMLAPDGTPLKREYWSARTNLDRALQGIADDTSFMPATDQGRGKRADVSAGGH